MDPEIEALKKQVEELQNKLSEKSTTQLPQDINTEEKTEYTWEAPVRIFKPWSRRRILSVFLWVSAFCLILIFFKEYILSITIILICLVSIALVIVPPNKTKQTITNKGILSYDKLYQWDELINFWFAYRQDQITMQITTNHNYPNTLFFIIPNENLQGVFEAMNKHLKYFEKKEQQNAIGKMTDGIYIKYNEIKAIYASPSDK